MDLNELAPSPEAKIALWRETLAQLRHLSDDVWRGFKCFTMLNLAVVLAIIFLFAQPLFGKFLAVLAIILSILGVMLTVVARYILKRHRNYYLQMLAKKALVEDELGFYDIKLDQGNTDLAFPWRLAPEIVAEIKQDAAAWIQKALRGKKTITFAQFLIYDFLLVLYFVAIVAAIFVLLR